MNSHPAEGLRSLPRIRVMEESPVSSLEPGSCPFGVIINFISGFTRCGLQNHAFLVHSSSVERMEPTQASFPSRGRLGHREETVCHLSDGGTPTQWPKAGPPTCSSSVQLPRKMHPWGVFKVRDFAGVRFAGPWHPCHGPMPSFPAHKGGWVAGVTFPSGFRQSSAQNCK